MAAVQSDNIMAGSVKNIVDRLSKDFSAAKPPMSIHEPPRRPLYPKPSVQSVPLVVATFAYAATQSDELTLAVGDVVEILEEVEDGWSKGRVQRTGQIGMFPTNFVETKVSTPPITVPTAVSAASVTREDAVVRRTTSTDDKPEAIKRTPSVIGVQLPPPAAATVTTFPARKEEKREEKTKEMARVKFIYEPENADELRLGEIGALIEIVRKDCGDAGWFEGELHGKIGLFPDNFVELVQVPISCTSGSTHSTTSSSSPSSKLVSKVPSKAPIIPPSGAVATPPAVPAKPGKAKLSDSSQSLNGMGGAPAPTSSANKVVSSSFADIRSRVAQGLKVVGPGDAPLSRSTIVASSGSSSEPAGPTMNRPLSTIESRGEDSDQMMQLSHVTKDRVRPPSKRPMSMMMLQKKKSTENLLDSPTSASSTTTTGVPTAMTSSIHTSAPASNHTPSSSMFATNQSSPTRLQLAPRPLVAKEEPKREEKSGHGGTGSGTAHATAAYSVLSGATSTPSSARHAATTVPTAPTAQPSFAGAAGDRDSEWVSRKEYNELLAKVTLLEARLAALEQSSR